MTPGQIKLVRWLLSKAGLTESKEELAYDYSNGRTTGLSDLTYEETKALVKKLNEMVKLSDDKIKKDKMAGKILSMAHEMHWELPDGKVDMARVNEFCLTRTPEKKPFKNYTVSELPKLVTLFEKVYLSFIKGIH